MTATKTTTRQIAERIQSLTGSNLISINHSANQYVSMGLAKNREEALEMMLEFIEASI